MKHTKAKLFPRVQFLKKFILYDGLAKYHSDQQKMSNQGEQIYETHDLIQQDLMEVFNCSPDWPICLFDFTVKQRCPNMFILRMR